MVIQKCKRDIHYLWCGNCPTTLIFLVLTYCMNIINTKTLNTVETIPGPVFLPDSHCCPRTFPSSQSQFFFIVYRWTKETSFRKHTRAHILLAIIFSRIRFAWYIFYEVFHLLLIVLQHVRARLPVFVICLLVLGLIAGRWPEHAIKSWF